MKKCPHCTEEIQDDAIKCRYCSTVILSPKDEVLNSLISEAALEASEKNIEKINDINELNNGDIINPKNVVKINIINRK